MNKTAAFNFLSNISLGSKESGSSNSSSGGKGGNQSSSSSTTDKDKSTQLTISKFLSKPISKSGSDLQSSHSWIFNLPFPSYKTIDPKVGSKITLNIKQKHIILKLGDRFYFSISSPMKVDRIVSSSVVVGDPVQSKEDTTTTNVILQVEKIFPDPIPRSIFASYPILSDLQTSKSSFTRVTESQLPQFLDIITNYTTKTVKKEALNFLTGISLGDNKQKVENSPNSITPRNISNDNNNNNNNVNNIPPISLNSNNTIISNNNNTITNINNSNTIASINNQQVQLTNIQAQQTNQLLIQQNNLQQPQFIPNKQLQQPPPSNQNQQTLINNNNSDINTIGTTISSLPTQIHNENNGASSSNNSIDKIKARKFNTIEEYNSNYNLTLNQRIFFVTSSGHPVSVFSMIKGESRRVLPKKSQSGKTKDSNLISSNMESGIGSHHHHHHDKDHNKDHTHSNSSSKETSYGHLLNSQFIDSSLIGDEIDINGIPLKYDPTFLDNSELKTGKHRIVMNLPSYKISILPFIKKGAIKEELNEQFRQQHTWIAPSTGVTLYKIRKIKRKLKKITLLADLDISTLALSFVLLEKMVIKNQINKPNFKLYAACCLLLAAKFNDSKALESLASLYETIEKKFSIPKKELLANEFAIFSLVSFGLFVDYHDVIPHLNRLKSELVESDQIMPLVK